MHGTLDLEAMGSICAVELVPLREEAVGVGEVADVEHGVVVGQVQVIDQPYRSVVTCAPGWKPASSLLPSRCLWQGEMHRHLHLLCFHQAEKNCVKIPTSPMSPKTTTRWSESWPGKGGGARKVDGLPRITVLAARAQIGKNT